MEPRAGPGHVFVSYSRRQFHAAQQLTTVLHERGVDAWFDVQRLVPGTDWAATLDEAIDEAVAVVLVASSDAVASAYVTREWRRAREFGIPVYVAEVRGALPATPAPAASTASVPADRGRPLLGNCHVVVPTVAPHSPQPRMIKNPDYPELPDNADFLLRLRAGIAVALAAITLTLAYGLARRALRREVLSTAMLALFLLTAAWALIGVVELTLLRLAYYTVIWVAAAIG